jgi:hypothetical protein
MLSPSKAVKAETVAASGVVGRCMLVLEVVIDAAGDSGTEYPGGSAAGFDDVPARAVSPARRARETLGAQM